MKTDSKMNESKSAEIRAEIRGNLRSIVFQFIQNEDGTLINADAPFYGAQQDSLTS